jgi:hypothetical protein
LNIENIIRVFPRKTYWTPDDNMAFIGERDFFSPADRDIPVMVSSAFTWDRKEAERIAESWGAYYRNVQIGGPAFNSQAGDFVPGMFLKRGCVITTRGCVKNCKWCFVPKREGKLIELKINDGWIIQDNNILAASKSHFEAIIQMLKRQKRRAFFTGGLDKHFLKDWHIDLLRQIKIGELWFACDIKADIESLKAAREKLGSHFSLNQLRCYVMIGFNGQSPDALRDDLARCRAVYEIGFLPFCQLFQPMTEKRIEYSKEWRAACRYWSRPAIYRAKQNEHSAD